MIGMRSLAALAAVVNIVYAAAVPEPEPWHVAMLKRQEPGTPAYACHLACGTAITLSRGSDPCTDSEFLSDYAECLLCAGPDNINIWRYYGATLTTAGTNCGLSTTPASGSSATTTSSSAEPTAEPTPEPTPSSTTTPEPVTESTSSSSEPTPETTTTPAPAGETTSSSAVSSSEPTGTGYPTGTTSATSSAVAESTPTVSTTAAPTYTPHATGSLTTTAGNSTSTIAFTGAGNPAHGKIAGAIALAGAVVAAVL